MVIKGNLRIDDLDARGDLDIRSNYIKGNLNCGGNHISRDMDITRNYIKGEVVHDEELCDTDDYDGPDIDDWDW